MTHPGSKLSVPGALTGIALAFFVLLLTVPAGHALAQEGDGATRGPKAWTSYVNRTGVVAATQPEAAAVPAQSGQSPYLLAAVAFLLAGVAGAAGYYGARSRMGAEVADAVSKIRLPAPPAAPAPTQVSIPRFPIELRAAEAIEGFGTILVVDTDGDILVLYVDAAKGSASFLCRLSEAPAMGWRLDEVIAGVVKAIRQGTPREAALAATRVISRDGLRSEGAQAAPGQDEDLDVLLDELLGKVRGLKPSVKSDNEL